MGKDNRRGYSEHPNDGLGQNGITFVNNNSIDESIDGYSQDKRTLPTQTQKPYRVLVLSL